MTREIMRRMRARDRVEADPAVRQRYEQMLAIAAELTGETGHPGDIMAAALVLALDVEQPPARTIDRREGGVLTRYYSVTFPVADDDLGLRDDDLRFQYAMREVLAWLRGGITPPELADMGLRNAWETISGWVDRTRGGG